MGAGEGSFQDKQSSGVVLRPAEPAWPGHGRRGSGPGGLCPLPQPTLRAGGPALGAMSARGGQGGLTSEGRSPELRPELDRGSRIGAIPRCSHSHREHPLPQRQ